MINDESDPEPSVDEMISSSEKLSTAQSFFRDLVNPIDFPANYVNYILRIMKLMQNSYSSITMIQIEMKQLRELTQLPSRPGESTSLIPSPRFFSFSKF